MRQRLEELEQRLHEAMQQLAEKRAAETDPPEQAKGCDLGFMPTGENQVRVWLATRGRVYPFKRTDDGSDPTARAWWEFVRWDNGRRYELHEGEPVGRIECTCPGCQEYGPTCAGGQGCKHARLVKALRRAVDCGR